MKTTRQTWPLWAGAAAWGVLAAWAVARSLRSDRPAKSRAPRQPAASASEPSQVQPMASAPVLFLEDESHDPCSTATLSDLREQFGLEPSDLGQSGAVVIPETVFQRILDHVRSDTSVELGGVLFGRAFHVPERDCFVTVVTHSAAGHGARSGAASLEIGTEAWSSILADANRAAVEDPVVGWYHSHPNLGVFLSGVDRRTQQAHFPHEWSVALVVDPVRNRFGAFTGPGGSPATLVRSDGEGDRVPTRKEKRGLFGELRLRR